MKVVLEFEEQEEYMHALKGSEYHDAIFDFYHNTIRKRTQYCENPDCCHKLLQEIRDEFLEELQSRGIEL